MRRSQTIQTVPGRNAVTDFDSALSPANSPQWSAGGASAIIQIIHLIIHLMSENRRTLRNVASDFMEDLSDQLFRDSPNNFAGRDINQSTDESTTHITNYSNEGDVVNGDQSKIVIDTKDCVPESISARTVDAPFWDDDITKIDIKCKDEAPYQSSTAGKDDMNNDLQSDSCIESEVSDQFSVTDFSNLATSESSGLADPESDFEWEFGG